jgi:hypothetical protein
VRLLRIDERPDFIDLDALARQVAQHSVLIGGAGHASVHQQAGHRVLTDPEGTSDGANAHAFAKQGEDLGAGVSVKLVHGRDNRPYQTLVKHECLLE